MKRFVCIFLSVVLLVPLLCLSASAESYSPGQYELVDFLDSAFSATDGLKQTKTASSYTFSWEVSVNSSVRYVYLNLYAPAAPSSITFNGISGTLVYSGAFYQYRFSLSKSVSSCSVVVKYSSSVSRTISIGYCVGTVSGQELLTTFSMKSRGYSASSWSKPKTGLSVPYLGDYSSTIATTVPLSGAQNDFEFQFNPGLASADYATFHFVVPALQMDASDNWRSSFGVEPAFFVGSGWSHTSPLTVISSDSFYDASSSPFPYGRGCYHLVYTVDVSGFDLSSYNILCVFSLIGVMENSSSTSRRFGFHLLSSCVGVVPDDGNFLRSFTIWLNTQLTNIKSAITSLGTTITNQFSSLKTSLSSWFSDLKESIVNAINPPVSEEVSQSQQSVDDKIDSMSGFEQEQYGSIDSGMSDVGGVVSSGIGSFGAALAFVQTYTTNIANGVENYLVVFTLPIFVGIFLYACSRAPGVTRAFRDRRPKE